MFAELCYLNVKFDQLWPKYGKVGQHWPSWTQLGQMWPTPCIHNRNTPNTTPFYVLCSGPKTVRLLLKLGSRGTCSTTVAHIWGNFRSTPGSPGVIVRELPFRNQRPIHASGSGKNPSCAKAVDKLPLEPMFDIGPKWPKVGRCDFGQIRPTSAKCWAKAGKQLAICWSKLAKSGQHLAQCGTKLGRTWSKYGKHGQLLAEFGRCWP